MQFKTILYVGMAAHTAYHGKSKERAYEIMETIGQVLVLTSGTGEIVIRDGRGRVVSTRKIEKGTVVSSGKTLAEVFNVTGD